MEEVFRALKQLCHLKECKSRSFNAQKRYCAICLKTYMFLQEQGEINVYQAKKSFQRKNLKQKTTQIKAGLGYKNYCFIAIKVLISFCILVTKEQ